MARGLGVDLVHLPAFAEQVDQPGSRFLQGVLTPREARRVRARAAATCPADPSSALARHAGGLWAAKEAFVKAWSAALYASPPPVDPQDVDVYIPHQANLRIMTMVAKKLGIPVIGVVDTNHSPEGIDYVIPGNDDSAKAVALYARAVADAVLEGKANATADVLAAVAPAGDEFVEVSEEA